MFTLDLNTIIIMIFWNIIRNFIELSHVKIIDCYFLKNYPSHP